MKSIEWMEYQLDRRDRPNELMHCMGFFYAVFQFEKAEIKYKDYVNIIAALPCRISVFRV